MRALDCFRRGPSQKANFPTSNIQHPSSTRISRYRVLSHIMMSRIFRPLVQTHIAAHSPHSLGVQRPASASANYSSFPASLLRYNASQKFGLYDCRKRHQQGDKLNWDGIKIANNDLVELGASKHPTRFSFCLPSVSEDMLISWSRVQRSNDDAKHIQNARHHSNWDGLLLRQ